MLLELSHVYKSFGGVQAVQDVSLSVDQNQICCLIGPNGAGKTTIFNLITGIYRSDSGSIIFNNKDISNLESHNIAKLGIARTFQNIRLFKGLSVIGNLLIPQDSSKTYSVLSAMLKLPSCKKIDNENMDRCMGYLELLGLADYRDEDPTNLPYGIQRKVELGRALACSPKLLMLDEPAAGLNPSEVSEFIELLRKLRQKFDFSILLIEHRMTVVNELSEYIYVLNFGEILAHGKPEFVRKDREVIKAYLGEEG